MTRRKKFRPLVPRQQPSATTPSAPSDMTISAVAEPVSRFDMVPYDENLLERSRTQWQFGDWTSLAAINRDSLQHHPDRAKLALLAAAGHQALGNATESRQYTRQAMDWGCNKKLVSQILIAGVHNTLGRAAALGLQQNRALGHFKTAVKIGAPTSDAHLISQARIGEQLAQLGLAPTSLTIASVQPATVRLPPLQKTIEDLTLTLQTQKTDLDTQLKKQADDLIRVRKFLDSSLKKEVENATKQIEAAIGLQSYFATGDLPTINTERHSWPVTPDFALYLIGLLETNDYDLVIEFGSGISTVIIAKTLAKTAYRRQGKPPVAFTSFDHLDQYFNQTLVQLKQAGLNQAVQLHLCPLQPYTAPSGKTYPYYDCMPVLTSLAQQYNATGLRVLVVIDGPPAATGPHARYPAGTIVLGHFKGAQIDLLLDDYVRDDEKEIAQLWQSELTDAKLEFSTTICKLQKDACLIAIKAPTN